MPRPEVSHAPAPYPDLVIGSWPGRSFATNDFVKLFCDALTEAGCGVIDVADPRSIAAPIQVLQIHWPEQMLWRGGSAFHMTARVAATFVALARLRWRGVRLVWMVHNLRPHELRGVRAPLWRLIAAVLPRLVHGFLTLSPATVPVVRARFPALAGKPGAAIRQPVYPGVETAPGAAEARVHFGLPASATVYAMIGFLRRYKGAEGLITAFRAQRGSDHRLLIAGAADAGYAEALKALAAGDRRITILPQALDPAQLVAATRAADWIVLPFRDYLHSGSMIHALSFGRPVITPNAPFADELSAVVGGEWVRRYEDDLDAAALDQAPAAPARPNLSAFDPTLVGGEARRFYTELCGA